MTDIVERLRRIAVNLNGMPDGDAVEHAAFEIERLRVVLREIADDDEDYHHRVHEYRQIARAALGEGK